METSDAKQRKYLYFPLNMKNRVVKQIVDDF